MSKIFTIDFYKYFYDKILTNSRTNKEINFIIKNLEFKKNDNILDIACGYGRHSEKLLELGYNVFGIDNSKDFISYIRKISNFSNNYILGDIRNKINLGKFDKIYCLHTSFGYFGDYDNEKIINNISNILNINGLFLLDLNNPYDENLYKEGETKLYKGDDYIIDNKNVVKNKLFFDRKIKKGKEFFNEKYSLRIYLLNELEDLFNKYDMKLIKQIGDFDGNIFNKKSKRMILIFKKL